MSKRPSKPANPSLATSRDNARNHLRIIGGHWRGRKLAFPSVDGLRPTGDRIRETLFNWLGAYLPNSRCLDLFAGSGALGIEALSRGAAQVTLLEQHPQAAAQLQVHLRTLNAETGQVIATDALRWLNQPGTPMDIVFIDPPFQADLWQATCAALESHNWLSSGCAIYIETPRDYSLQVPPQWLLHREKHSGQVSYRLFFRE